MKQGYEMRYETKYETYLANKPLQKISENVRYQYICAVVTESFSMCRPGQVPRNDVALRSQGWGVPAHCLGSAFLQGCGEIPILFDSTGAGDLIYPRPL